MACSTQRCSALLITAALLLFTGLLTSVVGQGGPQPSLAIKSLAGRDLFEFYCAACHGRDAKGTGPVVNALRGPIPDLTTLAARHGNTFPDAYVESVVTDGPRMPSAHGSSEMPVWGPIFRGLDPNDRLNRVRVRNIVDYLASIQSN